MGSSRKNGIYISKYIPFFQAQVSLPLDASRIIMDIVKDRRDILDKITKKDIEDVVKWIQVKPQASYLEFITVLCVCNGQ